MGPSFHVLVPAAVDGEQQCHVSSSTSLLIGTETFDVDHVAEGHADILRQLQPGAVSTQALVLLGPSSGPAFDAVYELLSAEGNNAQDDAVCHATAESDVRSGRGESGAVRARSALVMLGATRIRLCHAAEDQAAAAVACILAGAHDTTIIACPSNAADESDNIRLMRSLAFCAALSNSLPQPASVESALRAQVADLQRSLQDAESERDMLEEHADTLQILLDKERGEAAARMHDAASAQEQLNRVAAGREQSKQRLERELSAVNRGTESAVAELRALLAEVEAEATSLRAEREVLADRVAEGAARAADAERQFGLEKAKGQDELDRKRQNELRLVGDFQRKELQWQHLAETLKEENAAVRQELAAARQLMRKQLSAYTRATEAMDAERAADEAAIAEATSRLRSLSPRHSELPTRHRQRSSSRVSLLSPIADKPSDSPPSSPSMNLPGPHARTLQF